MEAKIVVIGMSDQEFRKKRVAAGAIDISDSALQTALGYIRAEKEKAIDDRDFEAAAAWRDNEKNVLTSLGGLGLARPDLDQAPLAIPE